MEKREDNEGEERDGASAMEKMRAPSDENNGVVWNGNNGQEEENHQVTEKLEARAKPERIQIHPQTIMASSCP